MKFGIILPYAVAPIETPEFASGFAKLAEEFGFESLWVVEHVVMAVHYDSRYPYDPSGRSPFTPETVQPDPLILLTHLAAATRSIRLATGVMILPQRNPLILAKELASLDRLSGGRVELGVGIGWVREEAEALGTRFEERGRRADEYIRIMRTLWEEPVASFSGEFFRFEHVVSQPKPVQAGGVPIVIGGHSAAAARRAGRLGDGFYPLGVSPERLAELRGIMSDAACEQGRDPAAIAVTCIGLPDRGSAEFYESVGVQRMVVAAKESTLDGTRRWMEKFEKEVMRKG